MLVKCTTPESRVLKGDLVWIKLGKKKYYTVIDTALPMKLLIYELLRR